MVANLARPDDARVLVEVNGDIRFKGQPGAFQDDLGSEFISHDSNYKQLGVLSVSCALWYDFRT